MSKHNIFRSDEEELIKSGIMEFGERLLHDEIKSSDAVYKNYIDALNNTSNWRMQQYIFNTQMEIRKKMQGGSKYTSLQWTKGQIFGRDAYLFSRAINEHKKCEINNRGELEFDDIIITGKDDNFLLKIFSKTNKSKTEFEQDSESLPNIDEEYYKD